VDDKLISMDWQSDPRGKIDCGPDKNDKKTPTDTGDGNGIDDAEKASKPSAPPGHAQVSFFYASQFLSSSNMVSGYRWSGQWHSQRESPGK
jgi:hypothetical protein